MCFLEEVILTVNINTCNCSTTASATISAAAFATTVITTVFYCFLRYLITFSNFFVINKFFLLLFAGFAAYINYV